MPLPLLHRDHVKRVQRVAHLMHLQGGSELVLAVVFGLMWLSERGRTPMGEYQRFIQTASPILAVVIAVAGTLKVVAARLNRDYREMRLGILALLTAPASLCTVWCFPTAAALAAYGLWVYSNATVKRGFALRKAGSSVLEVEAVLRGQPGPVIDVTPTSGTTER